MNTYSNFNIPIFYFLIFVAVLGVITGLVSRAIMPRHSGSALTQAFLGIVGAFAGAVAGVLLNSSVVLIANVSLGAVPSFAAVLLSTVAGSIILPFKYARKQSPHVLAALDKNPAPAPQPAAKNPPASTQHEFQIKICPACKRTFSDISLNFCLDDGAPLSNVLNVRADYDPEETVLSPKIR